MNNIDYIKKLVSSRSKKGGPKLPPSLIDYNNGMNILSKIDSRIEIKDHPHPLVYCCRKINENEKCMNWICKKCNKDYDISIPVFLCTSCSYYLCQKCFLKFKVNNVTLIDPDEKGNICYQNHNLMKIKIDKKYNFACHNCQNHDYQYCKYCSLCNYILCSNCMNNE